MNNLLNFEKFFEKKKGLWDNIHAKRKRGEKAAKPGDEDYPDKKTWDKLTKKESISEGLQYHINKKIPLTENVYRYGSEGFFNLINETRELYRKNLIKLNDVDTEMMKTDIGKKGIYEGKEVWLDIIMEEDDLINEAEYKGKKVQLNKPKRGGSKKFYVYVKDGDKVKKVSFGAKSGGGNLAVKLKDPEARKAFASRHNCEQKNDKTTPGYWACRISRYTKQLGLSGGGNWW